MRKETAFICHSSAESTEAMQLALALEARGWTCWIAPRDIPAGAEYPSEIVKGIESSSILILLMSDAALGSPHTRRELELAAGHGRRIIPVRLTKAEPDNYFKYLLAGVQWIESTPSEMRLNPGGVAERIVTGRGHPLAQSKRRSPAKIAAFTLIPLALLASASAWLLQEPEPEPEAKPQAEPTRQLVEVRLPKSVEPLDVPPSKEQSPRPQVSPTPDQASLPDPVGTVKPKPEPSPIPFPDGKWTCEASSGAKDALRIVWAMNLSADQGRLRGTGTKSMINGVPANKTEKKTTFEIEGELKGQIFSGTYTEVSSKTLTGKIDFRFAPSFKSFSGSLLSDGKSLPGTFSGNKD